MPTVSVALDITQYVQINTAFNPMVLQAHLDAVRVVINDVKPSVDNTVFHLLSGKDAPLHFNSIDTDVWALAITNRSSLIVSETEPFPVDLAATESDPLQVSSGNVGLNMFSSLKESIDDLVLQMKILNKYMAEGFDNEIKEEDIT